MSCHLRCVGPLLILSSLGCGSIQTQHYSRQQDEELELADIARKAVANAERESEEAAAAVEAASKVEVEAVAAAATSVREEAVAVAAAERFEKEAAEAKAAMEVAKKEAADVYRAQSDLRWGFARSLRH